MVDNKKDILIISHFVDFPWEKGNDRFIYIAEMLSEQGYEVELITSDFIHNQKKHRDIKNISGNPLRFKVTLLHESGYRKNICLKRLKSHRELGIELKKYLQKRKMPALIYCAVPSLDIAWQASEYIRKRNVRFVIDIQDLWPEAFEMVVPFKNIVSLIFFPMKKIANIIYGRADEIVAVSETYLERGLRANRKLKQGLSVFLGTDFNVFDKYKGEFSLSKKEGEVWIGYVGTLGHSYDLISAIRAIKKLNYPQIKFIILGDGPLKEKFLKYAREKKVSAVFTGRLSYPKMVSILCQCDIAVNPIKKGAAQSIINKVGDYAAAGLPVINTQECEEYRKLIRDYNCGFNCQNEDIDGISEKIKILVEDVELRKMMGKNSRKLGEEKFDRGMSYKKICQIITGN